MRIADSQTPKDFLYGELVQGNRPRGRQTTTAIQGFLQAGSEGLRDGLQQMGNPDIWAFSLEAGSASWPLPLWRDPWPADWGKEAVLKPAKSGNWTGDRLYFFFTVEGMVTLELAFSATWDAVPNPLFRARYHSLLRLKDAYSLRSCKGFNSSL